jgi:acyl-CoA synthetase (AMP-forming)/AMP-acid ligase II
MAMHFADLMEHAVDVFGDRTAAACGDQQVTYAELEERANRLAHHLAGLGVGVGDHVGLYARNSIPALETLLAVCKLRAVVININYRYTENELRYMFADADLTALVHDREYGPLVAAAGPAGLRAVVVIDDGSEADPGGGVEYEAALAGASPGRDFGPRSNDDVYIIYTGGTTGYPKGVMWRHEDIWRTLGGGTDYTTGEPLPDEWAQSRKGLTNPGLVKLATVPLIHGYAQVASIGGLCSGDTMVLMPKFDAGEAWRTVERRKVNLIMIVGDAMARPLMEALHQGSYDTSSLVALASTGALFSPAVKDACVAALPDVFITEAVGSTETGFAGMTMVAAGAENRGGPTVRPGPDILVLDEAGRPVGPGEVGRLARGGHVPLGYYKDPGKSAKIFVEVGGKRYVAPGDWARVEEDGSLTLLGRGNTCVNTGGQKVYPEEVEGALKSHPDVFDALVIGTPDERYGQSVAALVEPRAGVTLDLAAVAAHLRGQIAGFKIPRSVWVVDAIARSPVGKPGYAWAHQHAASHPPAWSAGEPQASPVQGVAGSA